jgi:hypothetical protein
VFYADEAENPNNSGFEHFVANAGGGLASLVTPNLTNVAVGGQIQGGATVPLFNPGGFNAGASHMYFTNEHSFSTYTHTGTSVGLDAGLNPGLVIAFGDDMASSTTYASGHADAYSLTLGLINVGFSQSGGWYSASISYSWGLRVGFTHSTATYAPWTRTR